MRRMAAMIRIDSLIIFCAPLSAFALENQKPLPLSLDPMNVLSVYSDVIVRQPVYFENRVDTCENLYQAACRKLEDSENLTKPLSDFEFGRKLLSEEKKVIENIYFRWLTLIDDERPKKENYLVSHYLSERKINEKLKVFDDDLARIKEIAKQATWLSQKAKDRIAEVKFITNFYKERELFDWNLAGNGNDDLATPPHILLRPNSIYFLANSPARILVLSHEVGHLVSRLAGRTIDCLKKSISEKDAEVDLVDDRFLSEVFADLFSYLLFADYLNDSSLTREAKEAAMLSAFRVYCGYGGLSGSQIFPPGTFRANYALSVPELDAIACWRKSGRRPTPVRQTYCPPSFD
jgi:hypothetical protein